MRPEVSLYQPMTPTTKGRLMTRAELEQQFISIGRSLQELRESAILGSPAGLYLPDGEKLPVPPLAYRAVGSNAAPLASASGTLTTTQRLPLSTALAIPADMIGVGTRISGRAVFSRAGTVVPWASVRIGGVGGLADTLVTALEMSVSGAVIYFDIDVGPGLASMCGCHRYLPAAGDSFTLNELAMSAPTPSGWFVSFGASFPSVDAASTVKLLSYDLVVHP